MGYVLRFDMLTATQHLVCTAHRPAGAPPFEARWRSETVMALARGITADWAFDRLPILADALEEAGCDDVVLLRHCRECGHHTAHCWVLGDLFDRPPVPEPRRLTDEQVRREVEYVTGRHVEGPTDTRLGGFRSPLAGVWKWFLLAAAVSVFMRFVLLGAARPVVPQPQFRPPTYPPAQFKR